MNFQYQHLIPEDFNGDSRVWIYQANRLFTIAEALQAESILNNFVAQWKTHGTPVKGFATLLFGRFIVLLADETAAGVSGCSTDTMMRMIQQIEKDCNVHLFNRQLLAFVVKGKIELLPLAQLKICS